MLDIHVAVGIALLVATLALAILAWFSRRAQSAPLGLRLLLMGVALLLLVQFGAGTAMLARGHWIVGSHYGTALLTLPLLVLPLVASGYRPALWLVSSAGLFLVVLGTAIIGWTV